MILKFDHISFSCDESTHYMEQIPAGYSVVFSEMGLPNVACKKTLLANQDETHHIFMLQSDGRGCLPIEVTQYPHISGRSPIVFSGSDIVFPSKNRMESQRFYTCMGMNAVENTNKETVLELRPFLDVMPFRIHVVTPRGNTTCSSCLDTLGYSSVGLIVDRIEIEMEKASKAGYIVTGASAITVHGIDMQVAFIQGLYGEIVELIAIGGKKGGTNENY